VVLQSDRGTRVLAEQVSLADIPPQRGSSRCVASGPPPLPVGGYMAKVVWFGERLATCAERSGPHLGGLIVPGHEKVPGYGQLMSSMRSASTPTLRQSRVHSVGWPRHVPSPPTWDRGIYGVDPTVGTMSTGVRKVIIPDAYATSPVRCRSEAPAHLVLSRSSASSFCASPGRTTHATPNSSEGPRHPRTTVKVPREYAHRTKTGVQATSPRG
jgi:hypothetical protein